MVIDQAKLGVMQRRSFVCVPCMRRCSIGATNEQRGNPFFARRGMGVGNWTADSATCVCEKHGVLRAA